MNNRLMNPLEAKNHNREQLKQCFIDLANRAQELNEPYVHSVSIMLAASIAEGSDPLFAVWCSEFAKIRIADIQQKLDDDFST